MDTTYRIYLSRSELDTVLAGLRLLQLHNDGSLICSIAQAPDPYPMSLIDRIAAENGQPLTNDRIDALCERISA